MIVHEHYSLPIDTIFFHFISSVYFFALAFAGHEKNEGKIEMVNFGAGNAVAMSEYVCVVVV